MQKSGFKHIIDAFKLEEGGKIKLRGWVDNVRVQGGLSFIDLRDSTGKIQVTIKRQNLINANYDEIVKNLSRESSVFIEGSVKNDPRAPGGREVICSNVGIIGKSEEYPIRKGVSISYLLDHRHLYLRREKMQAILKIRNKLLEGARLWLKENGYFEIHCPTFITASVEGGATLFKVDYFGKEAYLTQSSQFYLEAAIFGFEKVFTIQPSFRAEKSRTRKHLTEFWHLEVEVAFADHDEIMQIEEDLLYNMVKYAIDECKKEFEILKRSNFEPPKRPFIKMTYLQALEIIRSKGIEIKFGDDIGADEEKIVADTLDRPAFIMYFPKVTKAFYHHPHPEDDNLTLSSDLYAPGQGEIAGGGQRIHELDLLLKRIQENNLNPKDYEWYIDLRRYGSVPHSGFGMGIERIVKWVTGINHVRDAIAFPRTMNRVYP